MCDYDGDQVFTVSYDKRNAYFEYVKTLYGQYYSKPRENNTIAFTTALKIGMHFQTG